MQFGGLGATVDRFDANQDVIGSGFSVFNKNVEIAVVVEDSGIDQLEL